MFVIRSNTTAADVIYIYEPRHEKTNVLVPTRFDTNKAVQLQKMARVL